MPHRRPRRKLPDWALVLGAVAGIAIVLATVVGIQMRMARGSKELLRAQRQANDQYRAELLAIARLNEEIDTQEQSLREYLVTMQKITQHTRAAMAVATLDHNRRVMQVELGDLEPYVACLERYVPAIEGLEAVDIDTLTGAEEASHLEALIKHVDEATNATRALDENEFGSDARFRAAVKAAGLPPESIRNTSAVPPEVAEARRHAQRQAQLRTYARWRDMLTVLLEQTGKWRRVGDRIIFHDPQAQARFDTASSAYNLSREEWEQLEAP